MPTTNIITNQIDHYQYVLYHANGTVADSGNAPGTEYVSVPLVPDTDYSFTVLPVNAIGEAAHATPISGRIHTADDVPDPPHAVTVLSKTDSSVTFSWEEPDENGEPIKWYEYRTCERAPSATCSSPWHCLSVAGDITTCDESSAAIPDVLEYRLYGLEAAHTYTVQARATHATGRSALG